MQFSDWQQLCYVPAVVERAVQLDQLGDWIRTASGKRNAMQDHGISRHCICISAAHVKKIWFVPERRLPEEGTGGHLRYYFQRQLEAWDSYPADLVTGACVG